MTSQSNTVTITFPSPFRLFFLVLAVVFLAEAAVMFFLPLILPHAHHLTAVIGDASMLSILIAPFLWWLIVRPLRSTAVREQARTAAVVSNAAVGIITINDRGLIESFNPAAEKIFGYIGEEVGGQPLTLLIPERYRDAHQKGLERVRSTGKSVGKTLELHGLRKDGKEFPLELSIAVWKAGKETFFSGIVRDISERKRAEEKLRLQSAALESAANSVMITDRDGIITWVNPAFTKFTGYSPEEAIGQNPRLLKSGTQDRSFYEKLWNTILSGQVWSGEIVNRRKDGVLYTEEQTITPVRNNRGEVTHFIAIKQNITDRKRAEKERARLISVIEATTDFVGIADSQGHGLYLNKNGRKMLGISEDQDISGIHISEGHPEPARKFLFEEAIPTAIREGVWSGENTLLTRDGREIPVSQVILAHRASDGSVEFLSTIIRDITERKQAEKEIQHNLERIRALREIDVAITSTLDLKTVLGVLLEKIDVFLPYSAATIRLWNEKTGLLEPVACRNLDENEWKANEWKGGRGTPNIVFESKASLMVANVQTDPRARDPEFFRRHGLISYLGVPLIAKDEVLGALGFYTKKEHEFSTEEIEFLTTLAGQAAIAIHNSQIYEEMAKLAGDLAKSNRVKDEFLSVMSHELRTPLNVVMGYTGMIKDGLLGDINPQQEEALDKVINRANDQLTMINNVLYATVIETEKVKAETVEVDLGGFLSQLRTAYHGPINKNLTLDWNYPSDLPVIKTDSAKLKQILQNLINNAIKFTEKGSVTVSARVTEPSAVSDQLIQNSKLKTQHSQQWVEFQVADTGVGIPKEHLLIIFEKFHQVDSSETRLFGGVGMGLYIVKKLTELLGGKIKVESEPGEGSTFTVTLPLSAVPDDSQADQVHRLHARKKGEGL